MIGWKENENKNAFKQFFPLKVLKNFQKFLEICMLSCFSRVRLCVTPQTAAHQAPRPWDSPGKNTGVGCHFLLQCMKVKSESESEVAQSCPTLSDPRDCSLQGSSIHGIFQAKSTGVGCHRLLRGNMQFQKKKKKKIKFLL